MMAARLLRAMRLKTLVTHPTTAMAIQTMTTKTTALPKQIRRHLTARRFRWATMAVRVAVISAAASLDQRRRHAGRR